LVTLKSRKGAVSESSGLRGTGVLTRCMHSSFLCECRPEVVDERTEWPLRAILRAQCP
jgi:hypothetical protein